jgi:hypothetical protein
MVMELPRLEVMSNGCACINDDGAWRLGPLHVSIAGMRAPGH